MRASSIFRWITSYQTLIAGILLASVVPLSLAQAPSTELWIHGIGGSPERGVPLGSRGVRQIINLRETLPENLTDFFWRYAGSEQGLCLTLRWASPDNPKSIWEVPPSDEEADEAIEHLVAALSTKEAEMIAPRLWIQFYNEPTIGRGRFHWKDADALFDFATRAVFRLRQDAPHVRIAGPSTMKVDLLERDRDRLTGRQAENYDLTIRIIEWSIEQADATSIHLHAPSGSWAENQILVLKKTLRDRFDTDQFPIACWEWSASYYSDREDDDGASAETRSIYQAMADHDLVVAAYSNYWVPRGLDPVFQWATLVDEEGLPNNPFYEVYRDLAVPGTGLAARNGADESPNPTTRVFGPGPSSEEDGSNSRIRKRRRK